MNVTFDNGTNTSQHIDHEHQDAMSDHSSSSSNEQSVWDGQRSHSDPNVASLDNEQTWTPFLGENGAFSTHHVAFEGSPSEKRLNNQASDTSTRMHSSNDGLVGSTSVNLNMNSNCSPDGHEKNIGAYPLSFTHISAARPTVEITGLPSEIAETPGSRCLDPFSGETSVRPQPTTTSLELEALDYLTNRPNNVDLFSSTAHQSGPLQCHRGSNSDYIPSPLAGESALADSADLNDIWYPNATYQHLHTALYHHMVETARNTALTRQASPDPLAQEAPPMVHDVSSTSLNIDEIRTQIRGPRLRFQPLKSVKMTQRRQLELWRNYLDEIAVWLDMFDNDRHFQFKIPFLAKSADHLHYSILALSARQMERKDPAKPYTESLGLYQTAIQLIVKELETLDTTVIASCVLLCVLEMMSSSPRAWGRHLNGCAMLLQAAGVNGVVGGVRQSLFWCFARMDVWGGYLQDTLTKIPTSRWFLPSGFMIDAVTHFKAGSDGDGYANYAVFLCASVVNVISNKTGSSMDRVEVNSITQNTYSARWKALYDLLEDWYNDRPEEMQPLMAYPSSSDEPREPFPIVLYGSSPAVNGNQLYHAAAILMLQDKPKDIRLSKSPKSILWHARQICGAAVSNSDHGAWINTLQPLWIAGKIMSHETEHQAILNFLAKIERETGWATAWRAEDLRDYWGDASCSETH